MFQRIKRAWLEYQADCHKKTIDECDAALSMANIPSAAASALFGSKLSAKVELFKVEACIGDTREDDGEAFFTVVSVVLVVFLWVLVNEIDYQDIAVNAPKCIYRGY